MDLTFSSSLVSTVLLIPSVLLTGFLWSLTTKISTSNSGQCVSGATYSDIHTYVQTDRQTDRQTDKILIVDV